MLLIQVISMFILYSSLNLSDHDLKDINYMLLPQLANLVDSK